MTAFRPTAAERSVAEMTRRHPAIVLAVSGGLDSSCLAHMAHTWGARGTRLLVATFDHRTGSHGARAVEHVEAVARQWDLPLEIGRAPRTAHSESEWRAERWRFLRDVAARHDAIVATAHTRDDHLETVVMRILRGAGARGLAGLMAETPVVARPLVDTSRAALANYAKQHGLSWVDDPTNESRRFFRNRVRLDLLPALRKADPSFPDDLLRLARQAADLRGDMERLVAQWVSGRREGLFVSEAVLGLPDAEARAAAWPAILGPRHLILDRRGIVRLTQLDLATPPGRTVPLSGGWRATRVAGGVRFQRGAATDSRDITPLPLRGRVEFGEWSFEVHAAPPPVAPDDAWSAWIPEESAPCVRGWQDGDRIAAGPLGRPRRVKRYFTDNRIAAIERKGWPVVVADGEIIWIPGIRRATAASARSGRPVRLVVCERIHH